MVREWQNAITHNLAGLMTLAGDQQNIARLEICNCLADRVGAVADLGCARRVGENGGANRRGVLAARIVVGDDDLVRPFDSDAASMCKRCGGQLVQRVDDNDEVVLERLKVYTRTTKPLVEYYRERPTFRVVNGAQAPERVAHELDTVIDDAAAVGGAVA